MRCCCHRHVLKSETCAVAGGLYYNSLSTHQQLLSICCVGTIPSASSITCPVIPSGQLWQMCCVHSASVWGEAVVIFCGFTQSYPMSLSTEVHRFWIFCLPKLKRFKGLENTRVMRYSIMKIEITCFLSLVIAPVTCHFEKH